MSGGLRGDEQRPGIEGIEHRRVAVAFGHVLRGLRRERAVSQEALAFDAAIDRTYPSLLERGLRHPTLTILLRLNTPRQITRPSDNAQMWTWFSDPFGTDAANGNPAGVGAFPYNLRFAGQVFGGPAGLHDNYFRDFDPAVGRYIESDLIGGCQVPDIDV